MDAEKDGGLNGGGEVRVGLPVRLQASNLRPVAYRVLSKKHGLNVQTDALAVLTEVVGARFGSEWRGVHAQLFLEEIARVWKVQERGLFIDGEGLRQVIGEMTRAAGAAAAAAPAAAGRSDTVADAPDAPAAAPLEWRDYFRVVLADAQPRYRFDRARKQFGLVAAAAAAAGAAGGAGGPAGGLEARLALFSSRYALLADRLARNETFQKPSVSSHTLQGGGGAQITLVKNLLGRDGQHFILFGLLLTSASGAYTLEDASDTVEVSLAQAIKTEGLYYCPGMFVVAEGIYSALAVAHGVGGCFHVSNIGHPPAERREASLDNYGHVDFMGVLSGVAGRLDKAMRWRLAQLERQLAHHRLVFLGGDCFLDLARHVEALARFFAKLEQQLAAGAAPLALVLSGLFASQPLTATSTAAGAPPHSAAYKVRFDELAAMVARHPRVAALVKFVVTPGAHDPWQSTYLLGNSSANVWPQHALMAVFTNRLARVLPRGNLVLALNPFRFSYLLQEIVVMRDNLCQKLRRNDLVLAEASGTAPDAVAPRVRQARKLVKTLLDQGTLQPFKPELKAVRPQLDHALRIEPLPTVLVMNDATCGAFEVTYNGCKVVNTGAMLGAGRKMAYVEYAPSTRKFEFKEEYF